MRQGIALEMNAAALPVVDSTRAVAALMPSCASLTTSFTPPSPRRTRSRRNSVQNGSASDAPIAKPKTSRLPSVFTPTAMVTATDTIRPP